MVQEWKTIAVTKASGNYQKQQKDQMSYGK